MSSTSITRAAISTVRSGPNQIFAVGGLPFPLLDGASARAVVDQVETHLLTPLGLRTLAPSDPAYRGRYGGPPLARDTAYHQGTVWPWLLGPFVDAWLRVHDTGEADPARVRAEARARFLAPLHAHLDQAGLDHVSEVADGDAPHTPGGTPFQAWSLGEWLRVEQRLAGHSLSLRPCKSRDQRVVLSRRCHRKGTPCLRYALPVWVKPPKVPACMPTGPTGNAGDRT